MKTLNLIGAGRVGTTLAKMWHDNALLSIQDIYARRKPDLARDCIGNGNALTMQDDFSAADIYFIATPDDAIADVANTLADAKMDWANVIVFHVSGAQSSKVLSVLRDKDALTASIHPVMTFADWQSAVAQFPGCYCSLEGDALALEVLGPLFMAIGAKTVPIKTETKALYHAATVTAHNHLCALIASSQSMLQEAGIRPSESLNMLKPLVYAGIENIFNKGPEKALTGPVKRGDVATVALHLDAIKNELDKETYQALARQLLELIPDKSKFGSVLG